MKWYPDSLSANNKEIGIIPRNLLALILLGFFFIVPVHFFVIGDGYGYGIQGLTYKYQITTYGESFIPLSYESGYVLDNILTGKTAYSIIVWIIAVIFYTIGMLLYLVGYDEQTSKKIRICTWFIVGSLVLMTGSSMIQYGPFFMGPAGVSILFGLPFLFFTGWSMYSLSTEC
jgi:hypothetical protein